MSLLKAKRERRAELAQERAEIVAEGQALTARGDLNDVDQAKVEQLSARRAQIDTVDMAIVEAQIEVLEEQADLARRLPAGEGAMGIESDPRGGFASYGDFVSSVYRAGLGMGAIDERLLPLQAADPSTTSSGNSGAEGGFAIPPEFNAEIRAHSLEEDAFLPMTDNTPLTGSHFVQPTTEVTPWGSTGAQANWRREIAAATQSNLSLGEINMKLEEMIVLMPVSSELLDDAPAVGTRLQVEAAQAIRWTTNNAIVNGTGAGQPEGYMNGGALVTQAKETSQTADTIVAENVVKMYARNTMPGRAVWVVNPDAWPQLPLMTIGNQPVFTPVGNGLQGPVGGTLLGRPVMMSDTHQTVGDLGDISFVDFGAYLTITKRGGISTASSIHLWFDRNTTAFRAIFRMNGQPWLSTAITPPNSSITRSPFVTLAARA